MLGTRYSEKESSKTSLSKLQSLYQLTCPEYVSLVSIYIGTLSVLLSRLSNRLGIIPNERRFFLPFLHTHITHLFIAQNRQARLVHV